MKITLSFFPTKSDYISYMNCAAYINVSKSKKMISYILGVLLIICAGLSLFLFKGNFILFLLAGIFIFLYFPVFYPFFVKYRAAQYYDHNGEKMISVSFVFEEDRFSVISDRYELRDAPYETVEKIYENKDVFIILLGDEEYKYFPKRALDNDDIECVKKRFCNK